MSVLICDISVCMIFSAPESSARRSNCVGGEGRGQGGLRCKMCTEQEAADSDARYSR